MAPAAAVRRVAHTTTLLPNGDVLITGGINQAGATLSSVDIFTATLGNIIVNAGVMGGVVRASHTATLMANGCVLVVGGNSAATDAGSTAEATARIYNTSAQTWAAPVGAQPALFKARYNHTATLLNTGNVLICGGQDSAGAAVAGTLPGSGSCELYTPTSCTNGSFSVAQDMQQGRYNHTATLLKDGKVWFSGGVNPAAAPPAERAYLSTTERYDPAGAGSFQSASPLIEARSNHTTTLMGDGKVLVVGGYNLRDVLANKGMTESTEIYDPVSNSVSPAAALSARRQSHSTTLSANGSVVVFGGLGNITTSYIDGASLYAAGKVFDAPSSVTSDMSLGVVMPTATITAGTALLKLDFLLNKPVFGQILDGEMWLSSPAVHATWGMVNFIPASETIAARGLRINLAGVDVGCRKPSGAGLVVGNCGNIKMEAPPATLAQMQGQVLYYPRTGIAIAGGATVSAANMTFNASPINAGNATAVVTNGTFTTAVTIGMNNAFLTKQLIGATFTLTDGIITQASSFTVTMTGATATIVPPIAVTQNALGDAEVLLTLNFTGVTGSISFTGAGAQAFNSGVAIVPQAGASATLTATVNMLYTMSGANLAGETFDVDVATVVIRKMVFADGETYNPKANAWALAPPPGVAVTDHRYGHSSTLMPNNDTLVIGGRACVAPLCGTQAATPSVGFQLLYSESNFAAAAGSSAQKRAFHTSTLLPGGDILVVGGTNGPSILNHAELFTPGADTFSPVNGVMRYVRDLHTATLLPNGRVLITGGFTTNATSTGSTNTAEIYYPDTKRFIETSPMISSRSNHSAIMMPDGRVFVAGGFGPGDVITGSAEIFVSSESRWMQATAMNAVTAGCQRALHATVQLKDGRIMLIGGANASGPLDTSAIYTPLTNSWDCVSVPPIGTGTPGGVTRLRSHTATLLFDGRVLVAGGNDGFGEADKSYFYNPLTNTWTETDPLPLLQPRFNHTATLLPNGTIMMSGGSQRFGNVPQSIETFHINASSWVTGGVTGVNFSGGARAFHTMTLALNNKMYGIGGSDGVIGGTGVSLYTSAEAGYFSATPDNFSKDAPPSFRQATITGTLLAAVPTTVFQTSDNMTVTGTRFRGGTEASGGGTASANSAFSFPHMILQQVDGSGGAASQSNGGFVVDLTTQIFMNAANLASLDTSLTVPLPATTAAMPYGWYTLRMGANDIYSDGTMLQIGPAKPTLAPANITGIAAGISSMTWSWDKIAGVSGYNVYNATTGVFISSIAPSLLARSTFYQTLLAPSATTSIVVAGYTLSGDGPLTASPTSYTLSTCPINVTIASVTFSDLLLYWGSNGNTSPGTTYEVTQSSDAFVSDVSTPIPKLFNQTTNFVIITNLSANTTYYFRVQAFNLVDSPSSYSAIVTTRTRTSVDQPTVVSGGRTTSSINWTWRFPAGVTNYRVYNATSGVWLGSPITPFFNEIGLGTNTEHSIRVSAVTSAGEGPLSPSATAFTNAATPGAAIPAISQLTTGSFLLNWTPTNPLQTPYETEITQFSSDGSSVTVTSATTQGIPFSRSASDLIPSTRYGYQVVALNGEGLPSDDPPVIAGSTWTLPADPILSASVGSEPTAISVSWSANNNSSSATYEVTYTTDNFITISTAIAFAANFGGTSATIPGLVTGSTYSVRILARNPFGQTSAYSNSVTTRTFNGGAPAGSIQGVLSANADSTLTGTIANGSHHINLRAARNSFPSDVVVTISSGGPTERHCPTSSNLVFSIVAAPALQPIGSLYFSFDFLPADLAGIAASRALLLRYDPASNTCIPLETVVDSAGGWMTARINHFSLFQVGQIPLTTTAETARVFPNPYYAARDGFVTIDNVPPGARVRILTLRGEQVLDVKANTTGLLTWSGTNGSGRSVASGVYFVMVESGGTKKVLKLAVIR